MSIRGIQEPDFLSAVQRIATEVDPDFQVQMCAIALREGEPWSLPIKIQVIVSKGLIDVYSILLTASSFVPRNRVTGEDPYLDIDQAPDLASIKQQINENVERMRNGQ